MKKSLLPAFALFASAVALLMFAPVQAFAQPRSGGSRGSKTGTTNETYMVIQIGDEYKVVTATQYKEEEKKVKEDNDQRLTEWKDEIKNDPKVPRPQKVVIKKLKSGYKVQRIAQEYADKLKDEAAAANGDAPRPTPTRPPRR